MDITWLPIILALICTGVVAGLLAGLLGVGGGIVIVPVLYFIFQLVGISSATAMSVATGTSLLVIMATSVSSIKAHYNKGNVDVQLLRLWAPYIVVGALFGGALSSKVGGLFASMVFGVVAILVACNMLFRANARALFSDLPATPIQGFLGFVNGAISVVMGIGGGTLGVPILTSCNFPAHKAVGTSSAFGFLIAVPGVSFMLLFASTPADAPHSTVGFINLLGFAFIVPLSVLFAPVGVRLGGMANDTVIKRLFGIFLCLSGTRMIYQAIFV